MNVRWECAADQAEYSENPIVAIYTHSLNDGRVLEVVI